MAASLKDYRVALKDEMDKAYEKLEILDKVLGLDLYQNKKKVIQQKSYSLVESLIYETAKKAIDIIYRSRVGQSYESDIYYELDYSAYFGTIYVG